MLRCFIQEERSLTARTCLIKEHEVEVVPDKVMHKNVDIKLIKQYFTKDAWLLIEGVLKVKEATIKYFCSVCSQDLDKKPSVSCDGCLDWRHTDCVGAKYTKKKQILFLQKMFYMK